MTVPEQRVWFWLRRHNLAGFKFRRQHPAGRYFLDFYCPELKLAIELDGTGHDRPIRAHRDALRTRELEKAGIHVFRLKNEIVLENPDGAWEMIAASVARLVADQEHASAADVLLSLLTESGK